MSTTPFVKFKQDLGDNKFALNTAGYGVTEAGIWLPIKVTDGGVQEVRQSGTKVVLLPVDSVAIADTEVRNYKVDIKGISDIVIMAYSTLSHPVTVRVDGNTEVPFKLWDTDTNTFKNAGSVTIPAHAGLVLVTSHPAVEFVKRYSGEGLTLRVKCDTAPIYGSLDIMVTGVRI